MLKNVMVQSKSSLCFTTTIYCDFQQLSGRKLNTLDRTTDLAQKLRDTQTPLFGVESQKSLAEFDILGFSLSYELGATNILEMLTLAGIPLTWRERAVGNYPLIFAGDVDSPCQRCGAGSGN
jgi:Radical SAM proteins, N-terminal